MGTMSESLRAAKRAAGISCEKATLESLVRRSSTRTVSTGMGIAPPARSSPVTSILPCTTGPGPTAESVEQVVSSSAPRNARTARTSAARRTGSRGTGLFGVEGDNSNLETHLWGVKRAAGVGWKPQPCTRATVAWPVLQRQASPMALRDLPGERQTDARPAGLRSKERHEQVGCLTDAGAVVVHLQRQPLAGEPPPDPDATAGVEGGIHGILHQ